MALILTVAAIAVLLLANELWFRTRAAPGEFSRKFIHISVGSFVAFWPFFLDWLQIAALSIAFVVVIVVSKYLRIFSAIHSVQRPTYGEVFFALAVGAISLVTHSEAVYAVALLQMSLADGMAAVIGVRYGQGSRYKVLGATKSVAGTATFFAVSMALLAGYSVLTGVYIAPAIMLALAASAALIENLGAYGLDNLLVPLLIAVVLTA